MEKMTYRLFLGLLLLYSVVIVQTMYMYAYSFLDDTAEATLFGIKLAYYMAPLFVINVIIILFNTSKLPQTNLGVIIILWSIYVSTNVVFLSENFFLDFIRVNLWTTSYLAAFCLIMNNKERFGTFVNLFSLVFIYSTAMFVVIKLTQMRFFGLGAQTNVVFCVLTVLPWALFKDNKKLKILFLFVTLLAVVFSSKRSASIILVLSFIPIIIIIFPSKRIGAKQIVTFIVIGIAALLTLFYVNDTYLDNRLFDRFSDLSEDGGSGRDQIWEYVLNAYQNSDFTDQVFGHGHYKVSLLGHATAAHNDFIEVLYDYGFIGLIIYLAIHISIIINIVRFRKKKRFFSNHYTVMWIIFLVMSLVSILIVQQRYLIYMGVFWGAIDAYLQKEYIQIQRLNNIKNR